MLTFLLFLSIGQMVHSSCPSGFELVRDGQCRGLHVTVTAEEDQMQVLMVPKCAEIQGQPVIIHDDEDQSYWTGRVGTNRLALGLGCYSLSASKTWAWTDGSAFDYKPASYSSRLNGDCKPTSGTYLESNGYWENGNGPYTYAWDIYCTTLLEPPMPSLDGCVSFEDDEEDGVCYQIGASAESWQEAQMICRSIGADLASVHNSQENAFIRRLAVSKGAVNGVFLGGIVSGKGSDFGWIDGSDWDYQNFHPGFPKAGFGDCLAMDTSTSSGQWMNRDCSTKLPVACTRANNVYSEPVCSTDTMKEDQIITSPGYPYNASMPCEYYIMVAEGKTVELEIISLEANTCCDFLIIYDDYLGGNMIANLTGEVANTKYTTNNHFMKVIWQPDGGVNVRGVAMVFRGV